MTEEELKMSGKLVKEVLEAMFPGLESEVDQGAVAHEHPFCEGAD